MIRLFDALIKSRASKRKSAPCTTVNFRVNFVRVLCETFLDFRFSVVSSV